MVLFVMLQKVILTFESANEILTVNIQIKAIRAVPLAVHHALQHGSSGFS